MKNKILIVSVLVLLLLSIFSISAFADVLGPQFTWRTSVTSADPLTELTNLDEDIIGFECNLTLTGNGQSTLFNSGGIHISPIDNGYRAVFNLYDVDLLPLFYVEYNTDKSFRSYHLLDYTPSFSMYGGIVLDSSSAHWLYQFVNFDYSPSPSISTLNSGYYRLVLPIDIAEPTWIGDQNTVWYNMRGRVVTEDSNRAFSFYRLGFRYNEILNDDGSYNGFSIELLINDYAHDEFDELLPYLEIYSVTYFADEGRYYYGFNDLVLDSFVGIALDGDYEVDTDFAFVFNDFFEPYDYVYTGNPWFDIVDGVVDALKIDVFGSFSPWDILVTFIGISVFIWLLKLLAGG